MRPLVAMVVELGLGVVMNGRANRRATIRGGRIDGRSAEQHECGKKRSKNEAETRTHGKAPVSGESPRDGLH
ncbi:hypothetical protein ODJ79_42200 [Actinoplanes sp. KI2]|uniref:hypothetical protein n=1 Tax=Actinoplanes sp. KI2 TaxID=2983315 RepID=UPI0021D5FB79|nr:hypothetical protein [Actinoplanes sp. KI2]MCU7730371.1 hypothetical protein [Actinoplanes sp. KI2]